MSKKTETFMVATGIGTGKMGCWEFKVKASEKASDVADRILKDVPAKVLANMQAISMAYEWLGSFKPANKGAKK